MFLKNKKLKHGVKGVNAQISNGILMFFGCLFTILVLVISFKVKERYNSIIISMNDYSDCNKAINDFRDSSAYLTNQARLYAVYANLSYVENYFYEKNDLKRREDAVEIICLTHENDLAEVNIKMAFRESSTLEKKEMYAMRLVANATNVEEGVLPKEIQSVVLSEEDLSLPNEEKMNRARQILFNSEYIKSVETIMTYCNAVISYLVINYLNNQSISDNSIQQYFNIQFVLIIFLFVVIIALYIFLLLMILFPLIKNCRAIGKGKKMLSQGCFEIRLFSQIFNSVYDKNVLTATDLKHKAEHDSLTGLINRSGFNQITEALKNLSEPIAYLIVDIDFFKNINDSYGHLVGDEVLKMIANILTEQFRNTDYVIRIGGDEFVIIMTKIGSSPISIIQRKIASINKKLQEVSDDYPKVTLSVGVAFSDCGYRKELEEQADQALYKVKRSGRCNCSFYNCNIEE